LKKKKVDKEEQQPVSETEREESEETMDVIGYADKSAKPHKDTGKEFQSCEAA